MKNIHLVIADLLLPRDMAGEVCAGLRLTALEKMLARGVSTGPDPSTGSGRTEGESSLENHLCGLFGIPCQPDVPIAPLSAAFDGLGGGCDTLLAKPADCGSSRQAALPAPEGSASPSQGGGCDTLLAKPADCGNSRQAALPAPEGSASPCQGGCCWLRADPVHLRLQRDQLVLVPEADISPNESAQFCEALNAHFAGQGLTFFAPHPQRWYVRLDALPDIETVPLSRAAGRNVNDLLPKGAGALHWHQLFNEIQMLLFSHPANQAREARGASPVNSVWFWGGGCDAIVSPQSGFDSVSSDETLAEIFASVAGIPFAAWPGQWQGATAGDQQLLIWTGLRRALQQGDLDAWREALQEFETGYAQPVWQALRAGRIKRLTIDVLSGENSRRVRLERADSWAFWRRTVALSGYSMV